MIIAAAVLASSPAAVSAEHLPALVLSLAAPLGFGFGINVLVHKLVVLKPLARISCVSLGSVLGLLPLLAATPVEALRPATPKAGGWWWALRSGSALVPQLLYTVCAPVIGTARTSIAGSFELPTMFLVGLVRLCRACRPRPMGRLRHRHCGDCAHARPPIRSIAGNAAVGNR
jgi:hypothetical protein